MLSFLAAKVSHEPELQNSHLCISQPDSVWKQFVRRVGGMRADDALEAVVDNLRLFRIASN